MARPNVPKFGNWEGGDNVPYTVYFEKARKGRTSGKMINPNDPQENPDLFSNNAPQAQQKAPLPRHVTEQPEEPIVRGGQLRPAHEHRSSRENGEFRQSSESPARNENVGRRPAPGGRGPTSGRPTRQSAGSEHSFDRSPLHPHYQPKVTGKGSASPAWEGKNSYDSSHGTPERSRMRPANRGHETVRPDRGAAVPKFGEWDENNPSSADGYTHIFNKVREERHTGAANPAGIDNEPSYTPIRKQKYGDDDVKSCCFPWGRK